MFYVLEVSSAQLPCWGVCYVVAQIELHVCLLEYGTESRLRQPQNITGYTMSDFDDNWPDNTHTQTLTHQFLALLLDRSGSNLQGKSSILLCGASVAVCGLCDECEGPIGLTMSPLAPTDVVD